jgi:hypothetical protein
MLFISRVVVFSQICHSHNNISLIAGGALDPLGVPKYRTKEVTLVTRRNGNRVICCRTSCQLECAYSCFFSEIPRYCLDCSQCGRLDGVFITAISHSSRRELAVFGGVCLDTCCLFFPRRVFVPRWRTELRVSADERLRTCTGRSCRSTVDR